MYTCTHIRVARSAEIRIPGPMERRGPRSETLRLFLRNKDPKTPPPLLFLLIATPRNHPPAPTRFPRHVKPS